MIEIKKPRIECIETPADVAYGKYVIEPAPRLETHSVESCSRPSPVSLLQVSGLRVLCMSSQRFPASRKTLPRSS